MIRPANPAQIICNCLFTPVRASPIKRPNPSLLASQHLGSVSPSVQAIATQNIFLGALLAFLIYCSGLIDSNLHAYSNTGNAAIPVLLSATRFEAARPDVGHNIITGFSPARLRTFPLPGISLSRVIAISAGTVFILARDAACTRI